MLMGYQFKLEALRRYRRFQEDDCQKELAAAVTIHDQIMDALRMEEEKRNHTAKELQSQKKKSAPAPQVGLYENYLKKIDADILLCRKRAAEAERVCTEKRNKLMQAMKKRKAIERLKEKDFENYVAGLEHKEMQFINEMALNRYTLNQE